MDSILGVTLKLLHSGTHFKLSLPNRNNRSSLPQENECINQVTRQCLTATVGSSYNAAKMVFREVTMNPSTPTSDGLVTVLFGSGVTTVTFSRSNRQTSLASQYSFSASA
ncbi:hypothetical protein EG68_01144 [Paragonimus skrjabini miyazakii]|uniref:Uncharacterized protein n=1 Tax=Paragonimus skrjabini miyazakii TaxID=59628 RepID=A0A8S9ZCA2_9TREM|nr:hypothetical protein EG68_01144 [Paragonimus skrjabini miyazakii]